MRILTALFLSFLLCPAWAQAGQTPGHNLWRMVNPPSEERSAVYESAIVPWLEKEFSARVQASEGQVLRRTLKRSDLLRFENIDGGDRYSVHIEYDVVIKDVSGVELSGLKGQEVIFLIVNDRVRDYFPFKEYWIEYRLEEKEHTY